ncbi:hypothetical protein [Angustibacter speluncae]
MFTFFGTSDLDREPEASAFYAWEDTLRLLSRHISWEGKRRTYKVAVEVRSGVGLRLGEGFTGRSILVGIGSIPHLMAHVDAITLWKHNVSLMAAIGELLSLTHPVWMPDE